MYNASPPSNGSTRSPRFWRWVSFGSGRVRLRARKSSPLSRETEKVRSTSRPTNAVMRTPENARRAAIRARHPPWLIGHGEVPPVLLARQPRHLGSDQLLFLCGCERPVYRLYIVRGPRLCCRTCADRWPGLGKSRGFL